MTNLEAMQTMRTHLLDQGEQALANEGQVQGCMYRTPDGKKCAIGCLIPDNRYDRSMETMCASVIADEMPELDTLNTQMLDDAQQVHDTYCEGSCINWSDYINQEFDQLEEEYSN